MSNRVPVATNRCIVHIDVDAFYAQCEEIRNPALKERPLGITQKYLLVTSNYAARKRGVTKLMGILEAQQKCPDLVLVSGEDLTPYRQASKRILSVLQRFGVCERGGMDEMLVDVTAEVDRRIAQGSVPPTWTAHVHSNKVGLVADNKHRPMDLRVLALRGAVTSVTAAGPGVPMQHWQPSGQAWEPVLMTGCLIAQEMRAVLKAETGFRCSAGISSNRMLAKLVSGLHKPDDQTVLLPPDVLDFVGALPVRALPGSQCIISFQTLALTRQPSQHGPYKTPQPTPPVPSAQQRCLVLRREDDAGVGYKMGNKLDHMGVKTAADLRQISQETLVQNFGERIGAFLQLACRGQDPTPVQDKGPPKSITVEDSFKDCSSMQSAEHVIRVLVPDLQARMVEDYQETGRHASTLTLKWRHRGTGWVRSSTSCPMPNPLLNPQLNNPSQVSLLGTTLISLLKKNIAEPFQLTLLNIGVTNLVGVKGGAVGSKGAGWDPAFAKLLGTSAKRQKQDQSQSTALPLNGANDSRSAALKSVTQRRDYGAHPTAACISKSTERALWEEGRLQQPLSIDPSRAVPGNGLDAIDWEEEEDWANDITDEGHAWESQGLVQQLGRQDHSLGMTRCVQQQQVPRPSHLQHQQQQLPTAQPAERQSLSRAGNAASLRQSSLQTTAAQQQEEALNTLGVQPHRQRVQLSTSSCQAHQSPGVLQQGKLTGQADPAQRAPDAAESAAGGLDMQDHQLLGSAGCLPEASPTLDNGNIGPFDSTAGGGAAVLCNRGPQQRGEAGGADNALYIPGGGRSLWQMPPHPDPPDIGPNAGHIILTEVQNAGAVVEHQTAVPEAVLSVTSTEQSDYELALRLQAQEHAMHRQRDRPVMSGRLGVKQKPRQTSGTLHAFFKHA